MAKAKWVKPKKESDHRPNGRVCSWVYCVNCGLVYLNNDITRKAIREGCKDRYD